METQNVTQNNKIETENNKNRRTRQNNKQTTKTLVLTRVVLFCMEV